MRPPTAASIALTAASCLAFVAHEPLLVVLGNRGPRTAAAIGGRATRRLVGLGVSALGLGLAGLAMGPHGIGWIAAVVGAVVAAVIALARRGDEHTLAGEIVAAVALTGASAPVMVAAGSTMSTAVTLWLAWATGFAATVVAIHRVIARHKRPATKIDVALGVVLASVGAACLMLGAVASIAVPLVTIATVLVIAAPKASHLRAIGIAIAVMAAASASVALLG
jgi:hypothetical protein